MKPGVTILLLIFLINVNAQTSAPKKVTFGIRLTPAFSYRHLGESSVTDARNNIETSKMGYQAGISLGTPFDNKLGFESGGGGQFSEF